MILRFEVAAKGIGVVAYVSTYHDVGWCQSGEAVKYSDRADTLTITFQ